MKESVEQKWRNVLPGEWIEAYSHAWLTVYSIALGAPGEFPSTKRVVLEDAVLLAFWGSVRYLDASGLSLSFNFEGRLEKQGDIAHRQSGVGAWLAVLQPCVTGNPKNEYELKTKASVLASLLIGVTTRNFAYSRLFDNCISLATNQAAVAGNVILNPHGFEKPQSSGLDLFANAAEALKKRPEAEQRRIELSLHWYDKALRSRGVDSFLNNWIAIETLAMPDGSNIRPVNTQLADIYGLPYPAAAEKFFVGRLLGLRSKIVHDGEDLVVTGAMSDYINRLYEDLLHYALGMKSGRLGRLISRPDFSFESLLRTT